MDHLQKSWSDPEDSRGQGAKGSSDTKWSISAQCLRVLKSYIAYGSVCELETQTMLSGDLDYVGKSRLQKLRAEIGDVERMLKALIKSLENKHLDPWILEPWDPFSQLIGRRTFFIK